jgi:hypothetical protein
MPEPAIDVRSKPSSSRTEARGNVRLTRPEMLLQHIGEFKTEAAEREWIGVNSAE